MSRARWIMPQRPAGRSGRREIAVLITLVLAIGSGAWVSQAADRPAPPPAPDPGALYSERASFCPALPEGSRGVSDIAAGARRGGPMGVQMEPLDARPSDVDAGRITIRRVDAAYPHDVVGFNDFVGATTHTGFTEPVRGTAAAPCSAGASKEWFFPAGSSADGFNERLVVYNPFPGDAVVRVTFFTPNGTRSRAALSDVAVPSGRVTTIAVNRFILQQPVLGAQVSALRGRVAAWKYVFVRPPAPARGVVFTLGAPAAAPTWYFAGGRVDDSTRQSISLLNPTEEEAVVTVALVTRGEALQPPELVEMRLPRQSVREVNLRRALGRDRPGALSVVVTSVNEVPIAAERTIYANGRRVSGVSTQVGVPTPRDAWWLGPPAPGEGDHQVALLNTMQREVRVELSLALSDEGRAWSEEVVLPPGGRRSVDLPSRRIPYSVLVSADGEVVAERQARGAFGISTLVGIGAPQVAASVAETED